MSSRVVDRIQKYSGIAFGGFVVLHLCAPHAGALLGPNVVDDVVMIGRTLYHQPYIEYACIGGSLSVHIISSIYKRMKRGTSKRVSAQNKTGWVLIPLLFGHTLIHRVIPAMDVKPIRSLSPSELSYAHYVGHALTTRPLFSIIGYTSLTALVIYHGLVGLMVKRKKVKHAVTVNIAVIGIGLARIANGYTPDFMTGRYEAVYNQLRI
ncbi:hypothetical protein WALSEDRAFT_67673 [Wallemia mellicola CBS 633.66]|uniref:Mitochondrial adapter protein MCP1 transmembrane domain-containing protein n=1 Tax=Wallemia mellicola (strain ATCC MYA-4683 / CBS 633.66) TaxID=671144 RepID=I4YHH8_WALMC|nr:hypothetical protein WALSEDRAFT_67673 [Wallemia mellicola CBS 633.66]EIM23420.1 hypothetical protein WALSEDRAFT_67673 [Wallemia mellicola CBS 633.66]TIB94300.1 hypothetical protein E3Q19_00565 [Wallemia mellicola]TIC33222.1 hypothetical protein E3Q11_00252 [Wallemia mellicola]TIC75953.1 hypothetical protein E3Q00_00303 [Wallemia mellicola]|eukprot:XP_006956796.1 hypothetical protein WALSEDRAFT_67673 [Wallemia mellicola CBS 633.66]